MSARALRGAALGLLLVATSACSREQAGDPLVERAEFGVFYGGQVQDRREIPFELDASRQTHGLLVKFRNPLERDVVVAWELDRPGTARRVRDAQGRPGAGRWVKLEQATVPRGRDQYQQVMKFEPGDPLGEWRIRVTVDGREVLTRSFGVFDAAERSRGERADAGR